MSLYETIRLDKHINGVTELVLCRPEKLNALSEKWFEEMNQAQKELADDEQTRVGFSNKIPPTYFG